MTENSITVLHTCVQTHGPISRNHNKLFGLSRSRHTLDRTVMESNAEFLPPQISLSAQKDGMCRSRRYSIVSCWTAQCSPRLWLLLADPLVSCSLTTCRREAAEWRRSAHGASRPIALQVHHDGNYRSVARMAGENVFRGDLSPSQIDPRCRNAPSFPQW